MRKETLRVKFVDFWPNLIETDNYFYHLLSQEYDVQIDEQEPDILFHSVDYANKQEHRLYDNGKTKKVFYTGENVRPDWNKSHFAFTFDFSEDERNYRLPLWAMHINWFHVPHNDDRDQSYLHDPEALINKKIDESILNSKLGFCSFIAGQPKGKRMEFVPQLHARKHVHCAGRVFNNTNGVISGRGDQKEKIEFLKQFKFNISFENEQGDGYVTEKIIHPMFANCIPIYWGAPYVGHDFNTNSFFNYSSYPIPEIMLDDIIRCDSDKDWYLQKLNEPWFKGNEIPYHVRPENVMKFFKDKILK